MYNNYYYDNGFPIQLSKQMGGVVKGLDKVMQSMDLQKVMILLIVVLLPFCATIDSNITLGISHN